MNTDNHYKILHEYKNEDQYLVMNEVTGDVFLKKTLKTYDIDVFRWLSLNHNRHIPNIVEYSESNNELSVTEQFISGVTLDEYISRKAPSEKESIRILCEICDGLKFLHSAPKPIIHRDLKGSNILITDDGTVKIIDYDAAKTYKTGELTDTVLIGTEGSAAPEQYGFAQSDPRTDIFAMGILIRKMIPDSNRFNKISAKATNLDPANRYQTAEELKRAIQNSDYRRWVIPIVLSSAGVIMITAAILMNLPKSPNNEISADQNQPESAVQSTSVSIESSTEASTEVTTESKESDETEETSSETTDNTTAQGAAPSQAATPTQTADTPVETASESAESTTQGTTGTSFPTDQFTYEHVHYYAVESHNTPGYFLSYEGIITMCLNTSAGLHESDMRVALDSIVAEYGIDFNQRAYENIYYMMRSSGFETDLILNTGYSEAKSRYWLEEAQFSQSEIDYACSQFDWDQEAVYYANFLSIRPHSGGPYSWDAAVQLSMEEAWFTQEQAEAAATELGFTNDLPGWLY